MDKQQANAAPWQMGAASKPLRLRARPSGTE
jgi:hypothetical protein